MLAAMDSRLWVGAIALVCGCSPVITVTMPADEDEDAMNTDLPGGTTLDTTTAPVPTSTGEDSVGIGTGDVNVDALFLLAMSASLMPQFPFQFLAQATADNGTMDLILYPLRLDVGSTTWPRTPSGDSLGYYDIPMDGACFNLDMGEVPLAGDTNPITGSDTVATLILSGCFTSAAAFCGSISGQITVPLESDLSGSTFGAILVDEDDLPVSFPTSC
jgi:hypothetical protein